MKKRILSFVLALVMAVSLLPVSVLAAEDAPAVQVEYRPRDPDVKVIGTYQVDEDTTWMFNWSRWIRQSIIIFKHLIAQRQA